MSSGTRLRRSASASRRDSKDSKYREKIAELEDIIRHQTKEFERNHQHLLHTVAQNERQVKSKTKQNLELNAKNKELTQSLKQLHQSFVASNQIDPANFEGLKSRLEQKDKEICALKQAAKERERKMEKMQLMLKKIRPTPKQSKERPQQQQQTSSSHQNSSYLELLTENANLQKKIALLESNSPSAAAAVGSSADGSSSTAASEINQHPNQNPWKHELDNAQAMIQELSKALEDRGDVSDVELIKENAKLQQLNETLATKMQTQQEELCKSQTQLQDAKDQADLLEFRVFELEEEIEKREKPEETNNIGDESGIEQSSIWSDSGMSSSVTTDSDIFELHQDYRNEKVADTKSRLQQLMMNTPQTQDKSLLIQTVALFEALLGKMHLLQEENDSMRTKLENNIEIEQLTKDRDQIVLELESTRQRLENSNQTIVDLTNTKTSYVDQLASLSQEFEKSEFRNNKQSKVEEVLKKQVAELQSKLDSAHQGREAESEMAQEALTKASQMERSVLELNAKLKSLMDENADLKEQLYSALEHHTTKSCESENSKVPSVLSDSSVEHRDSTKASSSSGVSSDCSDSDHEIDDLTGAGKFKSRSSDVYDYHIEVSTQTDVSLEEQKSMEINHLNLEIEKLTKFKHSIEARKTPDHMALEELDDLRVECKQLVTRKHNLECELENYKGEISQLKRRLEEGSEDSNEKMTALERVEFSLRNQLKEWEAKYDTLNKEHESLLEEKCELEEAENDSRLNSQRWEHQHKSTLEKSHLLSDELTMERKSNSILRSELDTTHANLEEARNEISYLESLVQRYEQRVFDLEELEVELREKLSLLEGAVHFAIWWNTIIMNQGFRQPSRPMIIDLSSPETELQSNSEDWTIVVQSLRSEKLKLTQALNAMMAEKESLAMSLEGNYEDKINRIVKLEDRIAELLKAAKDHEEQCSKEKQVLKQKVQQLELQTQENLKPLKESLEVKEDAYRQTIAEADSMLSKLEADYQETIQCLQNEKTSLEEQVRMLEQSQGYLKNQLAKAISDTERQDQMADLAERLLATERREIDLKEKLHTLQKAQSELELALQEQRKSNDDLKIELKDQDELIHSSIQFQKENQKLSSDVSRLRESESFLTGRVDELEQESSSLKTTLTSADRKIVEKEKKWQEKLDHLEDKLATTMDLQEDAKLQHSLKIEVEGLKSQNTELQKSLEDKTLEAEKCETAFRSEVAKLRNQLSISNNQLHEFDTMNCKLREELIQVKGLLDQHVNSLEQSQTQEEQVRHQWNQQLADKEAQIRELQDKLDSVLQPRMSSARSRDELETISDNNEGGLVAITKQLKHVLQTLKGCSDCPNDPMKLLNSAVQDLETLSSVFYGGPQSSLRKLNSLRRLDLLRYESEELLTKSTMALNHLNNSVGNLIEEEDEDRLSNTSSYHSSISQNDINEDHQAILAKSLEELQRKLSRMEQELIIVGEESKELQTRICQRELDLSQKDKELKNLFGVVEHMRQLNLRTVEHLEKQKLRNTSLANQLDRLHIQLSQFQDKCANKDLLIRTVVDLAQAMTNEFSVTSLVRSLRETTVKPSFVRKSTSIDFNLETLCQYLESSAIEILRKKQDPEEEEPTITLNVNTKINPTLMPPQNFRITRRVGSDSLLVAWTPPNDTEVSGYFIYINDQLHQKVRSAARTKALLHGLNLRVNFELSIHSIGCHGTTVSTCEMTSYYQDMILKPPTVPNCTTNSRN